MKKAIVGCVAVVITVSSAWTSLQLPPQRVAGNSGDQHFGVGSIHPRVSRSGHSIVFSYQGAIWRIPNQSGTMTRLSSGNGFDIEPTWSPDGFQIAYINSTNSTRGTLKLVDARDGTVLPLPKNMQVQGKLHFSRAGDKVLGAFRGAGRDEELAWFDLATGELDPLLNVPRRSPRALSHNGESFCYATNQDVQGQQGGNDGATVDLWIVSTSTRERRKLVTFPARVHDICWSHDAHSLYVTTDLGGAQYDIWNVPLLNPDSAARQITFGQADEHRSSVSADGQWLVHTSNESGATGLVQRNLHTGASAILGVSSLERRTPTGTVRIAIVDATSSKPLVARVSLQQIQGKFHAPVGSMVRTAGNYSHFYCAHEANWELPVGDYRIRIFRGPEYRVFEKELTIQPDQETGLEVQLNRWIHSAERGWYSGENHIHANYGYGEWYNTPETMRLQCEGEDLNVCNFMVANSDGDGVFDRQFFRGRPDPQSGPNTILYWNEEFRSTIWGHMTLVNLQQLVEPVFTGFHGTTNPWDYPTNSDIADSVHRQDGLVNYTHAAFNLDDPYAGAYTAKALPMDVALGNVDSVDINNSYPASVALWHRLLNCGFHLPASAGTDCFLNRINSRLPGSDRVYVKLDGAFGYRGWIEGLRAGRSFVTNGPWLELTIDGKEIGDTIELGAPGEVHIRARAECNFPIDKLDLLQNGSVVATATTSRDEMSLNIDRRIPIKRSGWIAVRATGQRHRNHPGGALYAHTSPIYLQVAGKPADSRSDAQFFLAWMARLEAAVEQRNRIPTDDLKNSVRSQIAAARRVYEQLSLSP